MIVHATTSFSQSQAAVEVQLGSEIWSGSGRKIRREERQRVRQRGVRKREKVMAEEENGVGRGVEVEEGAKGESEEGGGKGRWGGEDREEGTKGEVG